jgi:hypothetical protein
MQRRIVGQNKSALPSTAGVAPVTLGLQIHRTSHRTIFCDSTTTRNLSGENKYYRSFTGDCTESVQ